MTKNNLKWVIPVIALILVAVLAIGAIACLFGKEKTTPTFEVENSIDNAGGMYIPPESSSSTMKLMAAPLAISADDGIVTYSENSYTVTATVAPSTAKNKKMDWSVEFVNAVSAWAQGKAASSYVNVTPSGTDNATATVSCLKAFGEQVKVVAKSNDNANISAYCVCDYYERISSVSGEFTGMGAFDTSKAVNEWTYERNGLISTNMGNDMTGLYEICLSYGAEKTDYTIAENMHDMEITLTPTQEFRTAMKAKYSSYECAPVTFVANNGSIAREVPLNYGTGCYFPLTGMTTLSEVKMDAIEVMIIGDYAAEVLCANPNMCFMTITVKIEGDYNDFVSTFKVKAKQSSLPMNVTGLRVDTPTLNF